MMVVFSTVIAHIILSLFCVIFLQWLTLVFFACVYMYDNVVITLYNERKQTVLP